MNTTAIASHLNVVESAITRCEEWARVLFVVVKGLGARFVSKKVMAENLAKLEGSERQIIWAESLRQGVLSDIQRFIDRNESKNRLPARVKILKERLSILQAVESSKFWINSRGGSIKFCRGKSNDLIQSLIESDGMITKGMK